MPSKPALKLLHDEAAEPANDATCTGHELVDLSAYPPLLTVPEVVRVTRLGKSNVYALIEARKIVSVRMGDSIRVPRAALANYLRRCLRGTPQTECQPD